LNGAGEVAVRAFLDGRIPFPAIAETIENALAANERMKVSSYEVLRETDLRARETANNYVGSLKKRR
jgi:1-deoxy-D-xylulose-5-phosphate reductoisomerase